MTDLNPLAGASLDRRAVLRAAGVTAGTAAVLAATEVAAHPAPAPAASAAFLHGVASGDPLPGGILLWTRVTPVPEATPGLGVGPIVDVTWQVAGDAQFTSVVASGVVSTGPARDHTVKVEVNGLAAATTYWYRFGYAGGWSTAGRTMTAPATDAAISRLRFGVVSCSNWEAGYFSAYRHLAARQDLHLIVHLGDYLYEYGTGQFGAGETVVRPTQPAHEVLTLADYRMRHAHYKTDRDLQALHAALPWAITWDDHEVANDQWSSGAENHSPATEGPFASRLAAARQAYFEWMPVRGGAGGAIYRRLRFGRLAELSLLDLRTYRSQQGGNPSDPARTITGQAQMDWLKSRLATTTAQWKLVGNPVMISRLDISSFPGWLLAALGPLLGIQDGVLNPDQWDGYNADRDELVNHLRAGSVSNVVFLTGDIHTSWANELTTTATGPDNPAAAEFVVPSVTSDNLNDFLGAGAGNLLSITASTIIRAANPHVRWNEMDGHGYGIVEVNPQRCRMDWYHINDRISPTSGTRWIVGWSAAAGSSRLRREWFPPSA